MISAPRACACFLVALLAMAGCKRQIGDECASSTNCSITGDRLCDVTQPGGYCTIFNCEPGSCPDGAACVAFSETSCSSPALSTRFQRTFCLLSCESNDDCRSGYQCFDTSLDPTRQVIDFSPSSRRVCAVPRAPADMARVVDPPVCYPSDASFDSSLPPPVPDPVLPTDAASDGAEADAPTADGATDAPAERSDALPDVVGDTSEPAEASDASDANEEASDASDPTEGGE